MRLAAIIGLMVIGCASALAQQTQPGAGMTAQEIREQVGGPRPPYRFYRIVKITLASSTPLIPESPSAPGPGRRPPRGGMAGPGGMDGPGGASPAFRSLMDALWARLDIGDIFWDFGFQKNDVAVIVLYYSPPRARAGGFAPVGTKEDADKSLDAAVRKLKEACAKPPMSDEQYRRRLADIDAELTKVAIEDSVYQAINSSREQLWPGILMEQIKDSELQKRRLEMDLAAKEVRVKLLTRQIKQIEEEANKKIESDPVLGQLKKVVDLRKQAMNRTKQLAEQKLTSREELAKAEEQLLEAEIRVAERMETLRQNTKSDLLNRLSSDLATLMIDMAEMTAKLDLINKELPQIDLSKLDEKKLDELYEQYKSYFLVPRQQTVRTRLQARREALLGDKMRLLIKDVEVVPEDAGR